MIKLQDCANLSLTFLLSSNANGFAEIPQIHVLQGFGVMTSRVGSWRVEHGCQHQVSPTKVTDSGDLTQIGKVLTVYGFRYRKLYCRKFRTSH